MRRATGKDKRHEEPENPGERKILLLTQKVDDDGGDSEISGPYRKIGDNQDPSPRRIVFPPGTT